MTIRLHNENNKINIRRWVRQGDAISPKLFTAALESIYRRLTWETRGLKIDGEYLSHLRYSCVSHICANILHELQQMLQELADESENQGSEYAQVEDKDDDRKRNTNIYVNKTQIANVSYI